MKEYPLTDSDLHDLRNTGAGAALFFSLGSACLGIWTNIYTSLSFAAQSVPPSITEASQKAWEARSTYLLLSIVLFYALGCILVIMGYTRIEAIKAEVDFQDGATYQPKKWLRLLIGAVVIVGAAVAGYWLGLTYGK